MTLAGRMPVGAGRNSVRGAGRLLCALPRAGDAEEEGSNATCRYPGAPAAPMRLEPAARAGTDSNARGETCAFADVGGRVVRGE